MLVLPPGHKEIAKQHDRRFSILISKCRVSDCKAYHVQLYAFCQDYSFVYAPEQDETMESAFTVIYHTALAMVTETTAQELMQGAKYVS